MSHPWINLFYYSALLCGIQSPLTLAHLSGLIYIPLHVCSPLQLCFPQCPKATISCHLLSTLCQTVPSIWDAIFLLCELLLIQVQMSPLSGNLFHFPKHSLFLASHKLFIYCYREPCAYLSPWDHKLLGNKNRILFIFIFPSSHCPAEGLACIWCVLSIWKIVKLIEPIGLTQRLPFENRLFSQEGPKLRKDTTESKKS